jgi:50S ribosomal subunit-associated GTPase HflX
VILSDTVGFISELPTQLVEAFRATLEEVAAADIILHVRDAAHPDSARSGPTCSACWPTWRRVTTRDGRGLAHPRHRGC